MSGTVDSATAKITFSQLNQTTYQYSISLTNTAAAARIETFWFAWDDLPDANFMTVNPVNVTSPSGWFALVTHISSSTPDGYGIQFYTPFSGSALTAGHTLTGFSFQSTETPAQMFAASPFEPSFNTLSSFVYPNWPPTVGDPNGFNLVVACFAAGTRILTACGEIPVEHLTEGAHVATLDGRFQPIRWLGHRRIDCRTHPSPADVQPIRVRAGAFAPGAPLRDLLLSPDHAVHVDGALIPIRHLVNGATIAREPRDTVVYWHVELPTHAVILAEGLPTESYLDTGNRAAFANGGALALAHPDFAAGVWHAQACAPLVLDGPAVTSVKQRLLSRAETLGFSARPEPHLRLLVDGHPIAPTIDGDRYQFDLPPGAREARLQSLSAVPAEIAADARDPRRLGVALADLRLDGRPVEPPVAAGWHAPEPGLRWTSGDAALHCAGARRLEFALVAALRYWHSPAA